MIEYRQNFPLDSKEIARVFESSGITRPTEDLPRIARMFSAANVVFSAWDSNQLVGVCRALTDYAYCCYLADLAVEKTYQKQGIGKKLIDCVRENIGGEVSLILLAAPDAINYYPKLNFVRADNAFLIPRQR